MQNVVDTDEYRYVYINYCRIHVSIKHFNFNFEWFILSSCDCFARMHKWKFYV